MTVSASEELEILHWLFSNVICKIVKIQVLRLGTLGIKLQKVRKRWAHYYSAVLRTILLGLFKHLVQKTRENPLAFNLQGNSSMEETSFHHAFWLHIRSATGLFPSQYANSSDYGNRRYLLSEVHHPADLWLLVCLWWWGQGEGMLDRLSVSLFFTHSTLCSFSGVCLMVIRKLWACTHGVVFQTPVS